MTRTRRSTGPAPVAARPPPAAAAIRAPARTATASNASARTLGPRLGVRHPFRRSRGEILAENRLFVAGDRLCADSRATHEHAGHVDAGAAQSCTSGRGDE